MKRLHLPRGLSWLRRHRRGAGLLAAGLIGLLAADRLFPLPLPAGLDGMVILARDGTPLRTYPGEDGVWRHPVSLQQVSPHYIEALLGFEDRAFWYHPGINPWALLRAAGQWMRHGKVVSGGSTLTMQVARRLDPHPRSLGGKLRQMARALQLEWHFSKREILTLYLNHAPMGGIVEGVEMASRAYLGKSSRHLSHAEAALLAALPQAPSRLRPDRFPQAAEAARNKVLERLQRNGHWPAGIVEDARIEKVVASRIRAQWLAPLAAERMRAQRLAKGAAHRGYLPLHTTLDAGMQQSLERILLDRIGMLPPKVSMAALLMDNDTLEIRAYAGSADFHDASRAAHVDMVRGVRSPGSTLKPFLYALALDEGLIHSESLLSDTPQAFRGYQPGNFQANFSGPVSVSEALQRSLNVPAVDLLDRLGPERFAAMMRAGGVRLRLAAGEPPNLSLILGGAGTTLEELVGAYRALARGGLAGTPRLSPEAPRNETKIMSEEAAFIVRDILESGGDPDRPFQEGTPRLAWKTGTSFGFRDAWAIGVTERYTLGVWVGRPDGTPNPGFFGANTAAPLLKDLLGALPPAPAGSAARPGSVKAETICWPLGRALEDTDPRHCHLRRRAWVMHDTVPPTLPDRLAQTSLLQTIWIDPASGERVTPGCRAAATTQTLARWPAELEPWLDHPLLRAHRPPPLAARCQAAIDDNGRVRITGLDDNSTVMPAAGKTTVELEIGARGLAGTAHWLLDGAHLQTTRGNQMWRLGVRQNGWHSLTVMDESARFHRIRFRARGVAESGAK